MKITLKQLETFVWVADLGGFRRAAQRLNTTQPNISSRIAALEEALQTKLMERDAGAVRLTSNGKALLIKARKALSAVDDFVQSADARQLHEGSIRLGVTEMVAQTWLNDFLHAFRSSYPSVFLELSVDLAVNLESELNNRNLDLSFQSGPISHGHIKSLDLGEFPMVWVASAESPLMAQKKISLDQLEQQTIITHAKNTLAFRELTTHFDSQGKAPIHIVPSSNLTVSAQMVADGYGVGMLLAPLVIQHLNSGKVKQLSYAWKPNPLAFFARYEADRANSVIVSAAKMAQRISKKFESSFSASF